MSRGSGQVLLQNLKFPLYIPLRGFRMRCSFALVFTQRQAIKKTKFALALLRKGRKDVTTSDKSCHWKSLKTMRKSQRKPFYPKPDMNQAAGQ